MTQNTTNLSLCQDYETIFVFVTQNWSSFYKIMCHKIQPIFNCVSECSD